MTRHLEYAINLIGIEHVGVSSDYSFDYLDFRAELANTPDLFDTSYTHWGLIDWMPPETFVRLGTHLSDQGWQPEHIHAVLHRNFHRVATHTWPTTS